MMHAHYAATEALLVSAALLLAALLYIRGCLLLQRRGEPVKAWQAGAFLCGLFLIWLAISSPLAALDHELLTAHMVQHLLLMTIAPPLILLGAPAKALQPGLWEPVVQIIVRLFGGERLRGMARAFVHPAVCWLSAAGALVIWHIPSVFVIAMRSEFWHGMEQSSFLLTGLLFWWPVFRPSFGSQKWPEPSILLYLFLATLPCDVLSGFLVFCDRVVYSVHFSSPRNFGISALEDQQLAAALMWTCVTIVFLITGGIFTARMLSPRFSPAPAALPPERENLAIPRTLETV
jgi:putative membrane protein